MVGFSTTNFTRAWEPTLSWNQLHSEPHGKCQTSENEDSCHKRADDSPARCSPRHFAKFIHCEHLAGVIGMFSLDTVLESRYVVRKTGGSVAVHFISTLATSERTWHALWLESIPTLPDFLLKLLFAEHISSVSFCHLSSLPQLSVRGKCSLGPSQGG